MLKGKYAIVGVKEDDEEEDPLDQFMNEINQQVSEQDALTANQPTRMVPKGEIIEEEDVDKEKFLQQRKVVRLNI